MLRYRLGPTTGAPACSTGTQVEAQGSVDRHGEALTLAAVVLTPAPGVDLNRSSPSLPPAASWPPRRRGGDALSDAVLLRLRDYLSGDGPCVPLDCQALGESARALIADDAQSAGRSSWPMAFSAAPEGDLEARVEWFFRLLCLLPQCERELWMQAQVQQSEAHAMAGSVLRTRLDPLLFDDTLPLATRCRLWAVWLATTGPGPIVLDDALRSARLASAEALVARALASWGEA